MMRQSSIINAFAAFRARRRLCDLQYAQSDALTRPRCTRFFRGSQVRSLWRRHATWNVHDLPRRRCPRMRSTTYTLLPSLLLLSLSLKLIHVSLLSSLSAIQVLSSPLLSPLVAVLLQSLPLSLVCCRAAVANLPVFTRHRCAVWLIASRGSNRSIRYLP